MFAISFSEYFCFTRVRFAKKIISAWQEISFQFVNWLWKKIASEHLLIIVFHWWYLASKLNYVKVKAKFITFLKSMVDIFSMMTRVIWLFGILFSIRFCEILFSMTEFCVKVKRSNVGILSSGVNFKYSSSVPGQ